MRIIRAVPIFSFLLLAGFGLSSCARAQNAPAVEVLRVPNGGLQPQIVADGANLHLLYYKGDPKAGDLYYVHSGDAGKTADAPVRVNSQMGSAIAMGTIRGGQIAVGRDGHVYVAWNGSGTAEPRVGGGSPMLYSRLLPGGQFEPQRNLMTNGFDLDGGGSLAADNEGRVYVAWHSGKVKSGGEEARSVWMVRSDDDGATFGAPMAASNELTGVCACCQLKVWAGAGQKVRLLYRSATNVENRDTYLMDSDDGGRTFRGVKVHPWKINACPMSSYAFAKNPVSLLTAWESEQQIFWAPISVAGKPGEIVAAPGRGDNRKHPVLATNARGETLLAWTEGTGWARGGKVKWQLFDATRRPLTSGEQDGLPAWGMTAVFARPDGTFALMY